MTERLDSLLDELARRHARGEELDLANLLDKAGDERDQLAELADRFLQAAPRREPSEADLAYVAELAEPPLLRLRLAAKLKVDAVVERLAQELGVSDLARLRGYYQRLEGGLLDPGRVDARVWSALESLLHGPARVLAARPPARPATEAVFHRLQDQAAVATDALIAEPRLPHDPAPAERDELDRLFLGAS